MSRILAAFLAVALSTSAALAAETRSAAPAAASYETTKAVEIETMRARLVGASTASSEASLLEAEALLRRYKQASKAEKPGIQTQLDAILTRLDMEVSAAGWRR